MGFANRGALAEKKVKEFLDVWSEFNTVREYSRLVDAKAAGRVIKAAAADFDYYCVPEDSPRQFGLIEVKETEHEYRLGRDRITQLARLRKREKCGGRCFVVVFHSTVKLWRVMDLKYMMTTGDKGSWNMTDLPTFKTCGEALIDKDWGAFHL